MKVSAKTLPDTQIEASETENHSNLEIYNQQSTDMV